MNADIFFSLIIRVLSNISVS